MSEAIARPHHRINRAMEYLSESEPRMQIGQHWDNWCIALLMELIDNALDATETHRSPVIEVSVDEDCMSVRDNGPGIPSDVISDSTDFTVRVSNKVLFVAPTRGQLGNALKALYGAVYVLSDGEASVVIESWNTQHTIQVSVDQLRGEPKVRHEREP